MKFLYFFIFIFSNNVLWAQVTLIAPYKTVRVNEEFIAELRVNTRDSLSSLQFTVSWNAAVIAFQRLDTVGGFPTSANDPEFGLTGTATGKLTSLWLDASNRGYRVPTDSFLLYKIIFKAVGENGTRSALQFANSPTAMRASNAQLMPLTVLGREGIIQVGTTAVFDKMTEGVTLAQNFPNPVDNHVSISFNLVESEDVDFQIVTLEGKIVYEKKGYFSSGDHHIALNTEGVLSRGLYVYSLHTKQGIIRKKLIKN